MSKVYLYKDLCTLSVPQEYEATLKHTSGSFEPSIDPAILVENKSSKIVQLDLVTKFIHHYINLHSIDKANIEPEQIGVLRFLLDVIDNEYLNNNDIHVAVSKVDDNSRKNILNSYFTCVDIIESATVKENIQPEKSDEHLSAIFELSIKKKLKLAGIFDGYISPDVSLQVLENLLGTYNSLLNDYVTTLSELVLGISSDEYKKGLAKFRINILDLLKKKECQTFEELGFQHSIAASMILSGLVSLSLYYLVCRVSKRSHSWVTRRFDSLAGFGCGTVVAVAISCSNDHNSFIHNSKNALGFLYYVGLHADIENSIHSSRDSVKSRTTTNPSGMPTIQLEVMNIPIKSLNTIVNQVNKDLDPDERVCVSFIKSNSVCQLTGPDHILRLFVLKLKEFSKSHISNLKNKNCVNLTDEIKFEYIQNPNPLHSNLMRKHIDQIHRRIKTEGFLFQSKFMNIPVKSVCGSMYDTKDKDLTYILINEICIEQVNWIKATELKDITHIVDFGPGGISGIGSLTANNKLGTGVQVIFASPNKIIPEGTKTLVDLLNNDPNSVTYSQNWEKEFGPKIVQNKYTGSLMLDTRMTRLLGKPHIMVAGMTPSTIGSDFVSSVLNSGYHIELAGGGHYSEASLREEVEKIRRNIGPGDGITVNVIFLNARMASLQLPLLNRMRLEGAPIDGVCISAGVPSLETSTELIEGMIQCGIKHISFKPGNAESIRQVVLVAKNNPKMNIILQWTGGRGGGHHSSEDFHQPILETYAEIRMCENVVLVAGSGFGGDKDTLPYITGDWSMAYERPRMPFDGILLGSRMMVAKECPTSYKVKQLIVDTPGVPDIKWADTYNGPAGGIISVISELGQPIHMIANRAVMLWDELDKTIFSLPVEERKKILKQKKEYIIGRLNKDYQRPWFGRKENGDVCDLEEMTYSEVIFRMVDLMFDQKNDKWIHSSYTEIVADFLRKIEERFSYIPHEMILQSSAQLSQPTEIVNTILEMHPNASKTAISVIDSHFFLNICQEPGRKPVPFIPILDENLDSWFKKDSLWQSEYLDSVVGQDAQKVCILQGPVAVSYANVVDEPVSDILNGINQSHIRSLLDTMYEGDETRVPEIEYSVEIGVNTTKTLPGTIECVSMANKKTFKLLQDDTDRLPTSDEWYSVFCGGKQSWLSALLFSRSIVRGEDVTENNIRSTLAPIPKTTTTIHFDDSGYPTELCVENEHHFKSIKILYECKDKTITITMNDKPNANTYSVFFKFSYKPETPYALIHEIVNERNSRVSEFYKQLWVHHPEQYTMHVDETGERTVIQNSVIVSPKDVAKFCQVVDNISHQYVYNNIEGYSYIPMDFVFSILWGAICTASHNCADANMLDIVHYSVKLESLCDYQLLKTSDNLSATARLLSVTNSPMGKMTTSEGILMKDGVPHYKVVTSSLFRGKFNDYQNTFSIKDETKAKISLNTEEDLKVLQSKEWLIAGENYDRLVQVGSVLVFNLVSSVRYKGIKEFSSVKTVGSVEVLSQNTLPVEVGCVDYESGHAYGNPVLAYLERNGEPFDEPQYFEDGGYSAIPKDLRHLAISHTRISNKEFALVTADLNPIHTNIFFANLSGLPGTIVHGMWTSAATRRVVETCAAEGHPERVAVYEVNFLDMVLPGDTLETKLTHVGMRNGRKIIKIETFTSIGNKVLEGVAEINPPKTAYLFTGQGSQVVNMGVDLYNGSEAVKEIWNSVDKYMDDLYGFSLLEIIRLNPSEKTIYFGGSRGKEIRTRYINMRYEITNKQGESEYISIFPEINERSESYTFRSPTGLLNATQFTQPSIMLFAMAASQDMLNNNLVHKDLVFAGHSLGEFCALLVMGGMVKVETMIELVFYRGLAMQLSVERNKEGASKYGMVAFNPSRIASKFMEMMFEKVVDMIKEKRPGLMEIVNYNIYNWQYVIAGELVLLDIFSQVTDVLFYQKEQLNGIFKKSHDTESEDIVDTEMMQEFSAFVEKTICQIIAKSDKKYNASNGYISLTRSKCTIPIPGIDVPFHSSFLLSGVPLMRQFLHKSITKENVVVEQLERRYIPNVTGKMFAVSKAYFEMVYSAIHSPHLREVIDHWDESHLADRHEKQRLGHILLVELLSYQFASPVQWIETQNTIFGDCNIEQAIEVGPSSVLVGMATRTIHAKFKDQDDLEGIQRTILHCISDKEFIYHANRQNESNEPQESNASLPISSKKLSTDKQSEAADTQTSTSRSSEQVTKPAEIPTATPADLHYSPALENSSGDGHRSQGVAAQIEDVKITAREIITSIVAQKLKKSYIDISDSKSIKDLVNGKSAMQNEIISDLQKEFQNQLPDKAEEMPLIELFGQLNNSSGGLGPFSSVRVSKLVNSKMPGGFTIPKIKEMLNKKYGLGPLRADCLLLLGTTFEPENRLANEKDMNSWLEIVANQYAKIFGIQYSQLSVSSSAGKSTTVINSKEFTSLVEKQDTLLNSHLESLNDYFGVSYSKSHEALEETTNKLGEVQAQIDYLLSEQGEVFIEGIKSIFEEEKVRVFDSYWNWSLARADSLFYRMVEMNSEKIKETLMDEFRHLVNCSSIQLVGFLKYKLQILKQENSLTHENKELAAKIELLRDLVNVCEANVELDPLYKGLEKFVGPRTTVSNKGEIQYTETPRAGVNSCVDYLKSMVKGIPNLASRTQDSDISSGLKVEEIFDFINSNSGGGEKTLDLNRISALLSELATRKREAHTDQSDKTSQLEKDMREFDDFQQFSKQILIKDRIPFLHLRTRFSHEIWNYDPDSTSVYMAAILDISKHGISYSGKNVLVTGCGKNSIGLSLVKALLVSGANVIATTSNFKYDNIRMYEKVYKEHGSKKSSLTVVPFNQSSQTDINNLVDFIYKPKASGGLGLDLDLFIPFAAMSEINRDITCIDSYSELSHRTMLINIIRMVGRIVKNKNELNSVFRPTRVVVPLSLNHGGFGYDGLYAESKIGLETLFDKWRAESWGGIINIIGVVVGWARGTSLMNQNDIVAEEMEKQGGKTFSPDEIALNVMGLLHPRLSQVSNSGPMYVDISGGFGIMMDFNDRCVKIRNNLMFQSSLQKKIVAETSFDFNMIEGENVERLYKTTQAIPQSKLWLEFPKTKTYDELENLNYMKNMLDLDKTVVLVGYGEVTPYGTAETRWDFEVDENLSTESCIVLAWIMGYIEYFNGKQKDGRYYNGWIDCETKQPIEEKRIRSIYEMKIVQNSRIRNIDPELMRGYNPDERVTIQEIEIQEKMHPIITTQVEAEHFKLRNEDKVKIWSNGDETWSVQFLPGAKLYFPKATKIDSNTVGLLPKGWSAKRYGIDTDTINQVDYLTLLTLVSTCDSLMRAGIEDPYEFYKYVHLTEVGNSVGSFVGGVESFLETCLGRLRDEDVQKDILQETFPSSMSGWINLLLLSSAGPIKIPSTSYSNGLASVSIAVESIQMGKAKVMIAGGQDDVDEEMNLELFLNKELVTASKEQKAGRTVKDHFRPFTNTSDGFVESIGSSTMVLMSARTALEMGVPIYAIIAFCQTNTSSYATYREYVGYGVLSNSRECDPITNMPNPILDISYRKDQLEKRLLEIKKWATEEYSYITSTGFDEYFQTDNFGSNGLVSDRDLFLSSNTSQSKLDLITEVINSISNQENRLRKEAISFWTNEFWRSDKTISPIRGALSCFGLDINDIDVVSMYSSSISRMDHMELKIADIQFNYLGRTPGNICPVVSQKGLIGHTKSASSVIELTGLIQSINTGIIPGNRISDNISNDYKDYTFTFFPYESYKRPMVKAGILRSYGKSKDCGEMIVVHPDYLLASLDRHEYASYLKKRNQRQIKANRYYQNTLTGLKKHVKIKSDPPFSKEMEELVYMNPNARVSFDPVSETYSFNRFDQITEPESGSINDLIINNTVLALDKIIKNIDKKQICGIGIDIEPVSSLNVENENFITRNFTKKEIEYCKTQSSIASGFTMLWCAKEATIKAITSFNDQHGSNVELWSKGAAAPLIDIEIEDIASDDTYIAASVKFYNKLAELVERIGINTIELNIVFDCMQVVALSVAK